MGSATKRPQVVLSAPSAGPKGQERVLVVVVAGAVNGKAPLVGVAGVAGLAQPAQPQDLAVRQGGIYVGESGPFASADALDLRPAFLGAGVQTLGEGALRRFRDLGLNREGIFSPSGRSSPINPVLQLRRSLATNDGVN